MPEKEFLDELKSQFTRLITSKDRLDTKTSNMITMSGMISTLLLGIGAFLLKTVDSSYSGFSCLLIILLSGVVLMITTVVLNILAYKIRDQTYPMGTNPFFLKDGNPNTTNIEKFSNAKTDVFDKRMIEEYLASIKNTEQQIDDKGRILKWSQITFLTGIITIPLLIGILIHVFSTNGVTIGTG
ncbi:hypothetical protein [Nitrosopumilus sp.]|uniref:hypothetical protein n=1 Tax=Nitrosopumilus sp. TaxID=2024843 RepID=UPI00247CA4A6|nr:hypothetical protein [Nitrosopumilus sp.]MCV0411166.1 hypothetical protein [Nitrosopumilus sp.]